MNVYMVTASFPPFPKKHEERMKPFSVIFKYKNDSGRHNKGNQDKNDFRNI